MVARLLFLYEVTRPWVRAVLILEVIVGGWDTATQHIGALEGYAFPVINGISPQSWIALLAVSLAAAVFENGYRASIRMKKLTIVPTRSVCRLDQQLPDPSGKAPWPYVLRATAWYELRNESEHAFTVKRPELSIRHRRSGERLPGEVRDRTTRFGGDALLRGTKRIEGHEILECTSTLWLSLPPMIYTDVSAHPEHFEMVVDYDPAGSARVVGSFDLRIRAKP